MPEKIRFYIFPFGCQMNRHEAELLAGELLARGYEEAPSPKEADAVLYFTCSVRAHAEDRVWSHLGRWRAARNNGRLKALGVLGCMAERLGHEIRSRMPHVDLVAGSARLGEVPEFLQRILAGERIVARNDGADPRAQCPLDPAKARRERPESAYLAAMHGCDGGCTYCVVPRVRGRERSVPPEELECAAKRLVESGVMEITLLGQNIDRYGHDLSPRQTLAGLLRRISQIEGLARLRFVTSHPRDVTEELLQAMAELPNVMPMLHIPAQSGSDKILAAMRRGYTRARYEEVLDLARRLVPGIEIVSDFIVGFPGETESDFEETLSLVRAAEFQSIFAFKYSSRPGTPAAHLPDDVPQEVKEDRHARLSALQHEISLRRNKALIGSVVEVLAEGRSRTDPRRWTGRTRTGRIAAFFSTRDPSGKLVDVLVEDATSLVLLGSEVQK